MERSRAATHRRASVPASAVLTALLLLGAATDGRGSPAPRPEIARGKLLVASDQLADPNFQKTVVLLLEYAPTGALGVIINRPTDVKLSSLLPEVDELRDRGDTVLIGGPVARDRMIVLLRTTKPPPQSAVVIDGVYITAGLDALHALPRDKGATANLRAYVGYTGWDMQQLDAEIARGDWKVTAADAATLFDKPPAGLWRELNERTTGEWVRAPRSWTPARADAPAGPPCRAVPVSARSAASPCRRRPGTPDEHRRSL
jgi:putative transcriptional regulator